ncbi:MAG: hypothetical protein AB1679_18345 [Actinomycetota bacterium]|jgi:hypothetical protein
MDPAFRVWLRGALLLLVVVLVLGVWFFGAHFGAGFSPLDSL